MKLTLAHASPRNTIIEVETCEVFLVASYIMAEESPTVPHLAELDIPEHFLPVDPLKDPCHRQPAVDGEVWCYRR